MSDQDELIDEILYNSISTRNLILDPLYTLLEECNNFIIFFLIFKLKYHHETILAFNTYLNPLNAQ